MTVTLYNIFYSILGGSGDQQIEDDKLNQEGDQPNQTGAGSKETENINLHSDDFVNKIAFLVTKKIYPRLPESTWSNFNLTTPNTSMIEGPNTSAPIHYDNTLTKNDENDIYGYS